MFGMFGSLQFLKEMITYIVFCENSPSATEVLLRRQ